MAGSKTMAHKYLVGPLLIACFLWCLITPVFSTSIAWRPAAFFVAFQAFLMAMTGLTLVAGMSDGFFKNEPHTEKIPLPQHKRAFEMGLGGVLMYWGAGMTAALLAGGAELMCRVNLVPMLVCTYYHYAAGAMVNVKTNCMLMLPIAYFGFGQALTIQSIEWTPDVCLLVFQASLTLVFALVFLAVPDAVYKSKPHLKELFGTCREGELLNVGILSGLGASMIGAVLAGGAQNMCILQLPGLLACTYSGYMMKSEQDVIVNAIIMMVSAYFGFVR